MKEIFELLTRNLYPKLEELGQRFKILKKEDWEKSAQKVRQQHSGNNDEKTNPNNDSRVDAKLQQLNLNSNTEQQPRMDL